MGSEMCIRDSYNIGVSLASTKGPMALGCATCHRTAGFTLPLNTNTINLLKFVLINYITILFPRGPSKTGPVWVEDSTSLLATLLIMAPRASPFKDGGWHWVAHQSQDGHLHQPSQFRLCIPSTSIQYPILLGMYQSMTYYRYPQPGETQTLPLVEHLKRQLNAKQQRALIIYITRPILYSLALPGIPACTLQTRYTRTAKDEQSIIHGSYLYLSSLQVILQSLYGETHAQIYPYSATCKLSLIHI